MIVDAPDNRLPSKGGPGTARAGPMRLGRAPSELKLREELESLKKENAKLKAPPSAPRTRRSHALL